MLPVHVRLVLQPAENNDGVLASSLLLNYAL